jgi:hypothetical protein
MPSTLAVAGGGWLLIPDCEWLCEPGPISRSRIWVAGHDRPLAY